MLFNPVLMITSLITAAIAAATTTGVCLWAYRKGRADGFSEAYKEKSHMSSDLMGLMAVCSIMGLGSSNKGFTPSYYAPKDEDIEKLINALKDSHKSCNCKQEDSSQS